MKRRLFALFTVLAIAASVLAVPVSAASLPKTEKISVSISDTNPVVKWEKVKNAVKYYVYRQNTKTGKYKKIAETKKLSYTDKDVKSTSMQKYYVSAVDKNGKAGAKSTVKTTVAQAKELTVSNITNKGVELTWKKAKNATQYVIEYSEGGGSYKTLKTVSTTSYTVTGLKENTDYKFRIRARNKDNGRSYHGSRSSSVKFKTYASFNLPPEKPSSSKTITSASEFEKHLAYASYYANSTIKLTVSDLDVMYNFSDAYQNQNWHFKYGTSKMSWKYNSGGSVTIELEYNMYAKIVSAYRTNSTSKLTSDEKKAYNAAVKIAKAADKKKSVYEKEVYVHNYLAKNVKYDQSLKTISHSVYGALVNKEAVCEGYATAFKVIMDMLSIESTLITGRANGSNSWENHMWNMVKIDGSWYHVDVTWDRPISWNGKSNTEGFYYHKYLNVPSSVMKSTHKWTEGDFPKATSTKYNYYKQTYTEIKNASGLSKEFSKVYKKGTKSYTFFCAYNFTQSDVQNAVRNYYTGSFSYSSIPLDYGKLLTITFG